jgi:hypothetical protein
MDPDPGGHIIYGLAGNGSFLDIFGTIEKYFVKLLNFLKY